MGNHRKEALWEMGEPKGPQLSPSPISMSRKAVSEPESDIRTSPLRVKIMVFSVRSIMQPTTSPGCHGRPNGSLPRCQRWPYEERAGTHNAETHREKETEEAGRHTQKVIHRTPSSHTCIQEPVSSLYPIPSACFLLLCPWQGPADHQGGTAGLGMHIKRRHRKKTGPMQILHTHA